MSYSNNGDVHDIAGLTSLKNCYRGSLSGTTQSRLNNFGMLRLKDDDVRTDTHEVNVLGTLPIRIDDNNNIIEAPQFLGGGKYYAIPGFLIQGKNMCALGNLSNTETENAYNHTEMKYSTNHKPSNLKNGNYMYYPTIIRFLDSFTDFMTPQLYRNRISYDNVCYYENTNVKGVVQVSDTASYDKFYIVRYNHDFLGNSASNDTYDLDVVSYGQSAAAGLYPRIKLRQFSRTSLEWMDLLGITHSDMQIYENALFHTESRELGSFQTGTTPRCYPIQDDRYRNNYEYHGYAPASALPLGAFFIDLAVYCNTSFYFPYYVRTYSPRIAVVNTVVDMITTRSAASEIHYDTMAHTQAQILLRKSQSTITTDPDMKDRIHPRSGNPWEINGREYHYTGASQSSADNPYSLGTYTGARGYFPMELSYIPGSEDWLKLTVSSQTHYTCPVVLSSEPAICFKQKRDFRYNGGAYEVYKGIELANSSNTGTLSFYIYINNVRQDNKINITLSSDSGASTATVYYNGSSIGRIYGDGPTHSGGMPGCLVYAQNGASESAGQGFGKRNDNSTPIVSLAPHYSTAPVDAHPTYSEESIGSYSSSMPGFGPRIHMGGTPNSENPIIEGKITSAVLYQNDSDKAYYIFENDYHLMAAYTYHQFPPDTVPMGSQLEYKIPGDDHVYTVNTGTLPNTRNYNATSTSSTSASINKSASTVRGYVFATTRYNGNDYSVPCQFSASSTGSVTISGSVFHTPYTYNFSCTANFTQGSTSQISLNTSTYSAYRISTSGSRDTGTVSGTSFHDVTFGVNINGHNRVMKPGGTSTDNS